MSFSLENTAHYLSPFMAKKRRAAVLTGEALTITHNLDTTHILPYSLVILSIYPNTPFNTSTHTTPTTPSLIDQECCGSYCICPATTPSNMLQTRYRRTPPLNFNLPFAFH